MPKYKLTDPDKKLRELVLYLARESEGDEYFGLVKLNKLLFNIDFLAYRATGKSVTEQKYQALEQGPTPKSMLPVLKNMERAGDLALRPEPFFDYIQKRPLALREPDLSLFEASEIVLIDRLLKRFRPLSATQVSEESRKFIGWSLAQKKEIIPYSVALLGRRSLSDRERKHAETVEKRARKWLESRAT